MVIYMNEIRCKLSSLLADAGRVCQYKYKGIDRDILGITDDTRLVKKDFIFVCVKGERFDGHTAAAEMLEKGAAAVVCSHDLGLKDRQIIVDDTRKFYGLLTAAWFGHPEKQLTLIGITGTNGKTTMATMIHHILSFAGIKAALISTAGTYCGTEPVERDESTPTTPKVYELYYLFRQMLEKGCKAVVMEVSSFALDQNRIGPAVFAAAVFTNLTRDHLDYHGTTENYYEAKKLLFTGHCKTAYINTDDRYGAKLFKEISCPKYSYSIKGTDTSVYASYIKYSAGAAHFWFCYPGKSFPFNLSMMGSYNISNAVAAIAVCAKLGIPMQAITEAVGNFKGVRGRCESIPTGRDFSVICDYAHSPDAIENLLPAIKSNTEGRLICLFGCGGDRDRTKRPLMAQAAAKYADYLVITSDNPRNEDPDAIISEITAGLSGDTVTPYDTITDRRQAIFHAIKIAKKGDVVVLAGKGHEDYQVLKGGVHIHFDEREICAEALKALDTRSDITASLGSGMGIDEICEACGGTKVNIHLESRMINADCISSDTRTIKSGCIFIAFKGDRFDGHDYVAEAIKKGAIAAITERTVGDCPCIVVESTHKALLDIAAHYRRKFTPKLVGITGSVGKTTTKEMTALALSSKYKTLKTEGNLNNEIGMPFTLLKLTPEYKAAAIEMGMSHFGEIERLSKTCRPDIAVITNIGWSHAENLGSQEGILKAKLEILKGAAPDAPLIINGDDPLLKPLKNQLTDRRVITCGLIGTDNDYSAADISASDDSTSFTVMKNGEAVQKITLPCIGNHHIIDALIAFAAAEEADCEPEGIAESLSSFKLDGLRQHIEHKKNQTVIVDCYNAAPASMMAAIDVLCEMEPASGSKRVAVLGDMLELGTLSPKLHADVGEYAAVKGIDLLVCYGQYTQYTAERATELGLQCCHSTDRDTVLNYLKFKLGDGDIVLFKASRGIHMEDIMKKYYEE